MLKFLNENELNSEISNLIQEAGRQLIIISPFIKLHAKLKALFKAQLSNPGLELVIVFGKNENNKEKSLNKEDFEFFKQFPNIQIRFEERLHSKIYFNDKNIIITSMNLYDFSQDKNIESGVICDLFNKCFQEKSFQSIENIIEQADLIFEKKPIFEKKLMGLSKKFIDSQVEVDNSDAFYNNRNYKKIKKKYSRKVLSKKTIETTNKTPQYGYCIRTGVKIKYNRQKPFSEEAFRIWNKYKEGDYPEKFCHLTGEPSNGQTSFNKPILPKNWKLAMEYEKNLQTNA